jgi:hypothetical protein
MHFAPDYGSQSGDQIEVIRLQFRGMRGRRRHDPDIEVARAPRGSFGSRAE